MNLRDFPQIGGQSHFHLGGLQREFQTVLSFTSQFVFAAQVAILKNGKMIAQCLHTEYKRTEKHTLSFKHVYLLSFVSLFVIDLPAAALVSSNGTLENTCSRISSQEK